VSRACRILRRWPYKLGRAWNQPLRARPPALTSLSPSCSAQPRRNQILRACAAACRTARRSSSSGTRSLRVTCDVTNTVTQIIRVQKKSLRGKLRGRTRTSAHSLHTRREREKVNLRRRRQVGWSWCEKNASESPWGLESEPPPPAGM